MNILAARIKLFSIISILFVCSHTMYAQQTTGAPSLIPIQSQDRGLKAEIDQLAKYVQDHPAAVQELQELTNNYSAHKTTALPDTSCTITIPVVFHVFHPQGSKGVPMSQINYALNDLNITFAGADVDYSTVDAAFASVKSYTRFRWKLAKIDPKGNATTGVVYYKDKQSGFGNGTGYDREIRTCAWDNNKYFNIYIMNDLYCDNITNNSGVCWYPNTSMNDSQTARMVYNYVYLGDGGSSFGNVEFNQTFTHEAGHWMNLAHTFDGAACGGPGDYVADTPPVDASATGCTATRCSGLINGENYMDYNSSCYKNFTMGQNTRMEAASTHSARYQIWQYDNLVATGVLSPTSTDPCVTIAKFFSFSKTILDEHEFNNGSIEMPPVKIYACGGATFAKTSATLATGTDYTIVNVPAGLSASVVTAADGKSATFTLSGNATAHMYANSSNNMTITFKDAAIVGGGVSLMTNNTKTFQINFKDPWTYTCAAPGLTTTSSSVWNKLETAGPIPRFYGLWYNTGIYYLENYGRAITTVDTNSDNIIFLPSGTNIGPATKWRTGGTQGVLYSSAYPSLDGSTGYVGFRMQAGNDFYYGWMKISVSSATGITLLEYQYCNRPNTAVVAGSLCGIPLAANELQNNQALSIYPNPSTGMIYISGMADNSTVLVYDVAGRMLLSTNVDGTDYKVDLQAKGLAGGTYIIKVLSGNNITVKRVVLSN